MVPAYDKPPFKKPQYDYRIILRELRYWPITEEEARDVFLFDLDLILGCQITGDYQEILSLLIYGASALKLRVHPFEDSPLKRAIVHVAKELGKYGKPPPTGA